MHIFKINISIFNFGVFYMFRTRGKTVVYAVMVWYMFFMHRCEHSSWYEHRTHSSTY